MGLPGEPPAALLFDSELVVGQEGRKKRATVRAAREWQCPSLALALCCLQSPFAFPGAASACVFIARGFTLTALSPVC